MMSKYSKLQTIRSSNGKSSYILIVDYGSQDTINCRRIREHGVFSRVISCNLKVHTPSQKDNLLKGVVLSGGPESVGNKRPFF